MNTPTKEAYAEVYVRDIDPRIVEVESARIEKRTQHAAEVSALAEQAGLTALAAQDERTLHAERASAWCKARGLEPMTDEEVRVWYCWLPTSYRSDEPRRFGQYNHADGMPARVRKLLVEAQAVFSYVVIRTPPEPTFNDPILIGAIDWGHGKIDRYLLARWGESDVNFVEYQDIRRIIFARDGRFPRTPYRYLAHICRGSDFGAKLVRYLVCYLSVPVLLVLLLDTDFAHSPFGEVNMGTIVWVPLIVVLTTTLFRLLQRMRMRWLYPSVAENI